MAILAAMILPKPLRIRGLILDPPVVLAPLAGYSDLPFRLICRSCGAPFATTEVMLDRFLLYEGKLRRHLLRMDPADHPLGGPAQRRFSGTWISRPLTSISPAPYARS